MSIGVYLMLALPVVHVGLKKWSGVEVRYA